MKKLLLIIMFVMLAGLMVNGQYSDDQYYEPDYDDQYYEGDGYGYDSPAEYQEYYYDYENILPMIGRYSSVYYWEHPYKYVNFVIIGDRVYVIPRDIFYRVYNRGRFFAVSMERFIYLSCFGMPYYDNYYRFSFYSDYYRYNYYRGRRYGVNWFRGLRSHYRKHYRDRWSSRKYRSLRKRLIAKRGHNYDKYRNRYSNTGKRKITKSRSYKSRGARPNANYSKKRYSSRGVSPKAKYQTKRYSSRGVTKRSTNRSYTPRSSKRVNRSITRRSTTPRGARTYKRSGSSSRGFSTRGVSKSRSRSVRKSSTRGFKTSKRSVKRSSSGKSSSRKSVKKSRSSSRSSSSSKRSKRR